MAAAATRWKELTDDEKTVSIDSILKLHAYRYIYVFVFGGVQDYKRKAADDKERYEKDVSEYEAKYGPLKTGKEVNLNR